MNIRHLVLSVSRCLLSMGSVMLVASAQQPLHAADLSKFRRIEPQQIAALADPGATSGNGAQSWGLWSPDPELNRSTPNTAQLPPNSALTA